MMTFEIGMMSILLLSPAPIAAHAKPPANPPK